jgi:threonylcarbamoyladenosine tRNA methylthiotransferase MtaB
MPHLHLSLQSGDDMILKRMKRRHLRDDTIRFCQDVRSVRPDVVFGADIIAGFPTETEEMFQNSLAIVEEAGLTHLHVFPYSARQGTPAARMPQLDRSIVLERAKRLRALGAKRLEEFLESRVGQNADVLMERDGLGRTVQFTPVSVDKAEAGTLVKLQITGHDGTRLMGTVLDQNKAA